MAKPSLKAAVKQSKPGLSDLAAELIDESPAPATQKTEPKPEAVKLITTSFALEPETLKLLKAAAHARAKKAGGGRPSVSAILQELIERERAELEAQAGPFLQLF